MRAQQFGLVNRVVDDEDLEAEVGRMTERIAGRAAEAMADNKRLIKQQVGGGGLPDRPRLRGGLSSQVIASDLATNVQVGAGRRG